MRLAKPIIVLSSMMVAACTPSTAPPAPLIEDQKFMSIEVKPDQPGLSWNGKDPLLFEGFETQVAYGVAAAFQREPRLHPTVSEHREDSLIQGRTDAVIASFSMTPERKDKVDMVGPYLRTRTGIMVRDDYSGPADIGAFPAHRICTSKGTTTIDLIRDVKQGGQPRDELKFEHCEDQLRTGSVDAVVTDKIILEGLATHSGGEFKILPGDFGPDQYYGIAIPRGYPKECAQLKDWVQRYVTTPEWKKNFEQYFPGVSPIEHTISIPQVSEHSTCSKIHPPA